MAQRFSFDEEGIWFVEKWFYSAAVAVNFIWENDCYIGTQKGTRIEC